MNERFLIIKLFVTDATRHSAEAQLERILKDLPLGYRQYKHYVHDVSVAPNDEVAAVDNVTTTPCLVLQDLSSPTQRSLVGVVHDDQVRRFLLGLD